MTIKILFVCHGNICRSPMAEYIFRKLVSDACVSDKFEIASAATSSEEIWNGRGNPVYPAAKQKLCEHGIYCDDKRARQITTSDYVYYNLIVGMDEMNIRNMQRVYHNDQEGKIHLLLEYTGNRRSISDPWYSGDFDTAYREIEEGCIALFKYLTSKYLTSESGHLQS